MEPHHNLRHYKHEALMRYAKILGFGEIHTKVDPDTGLHAIIAVHSTKLGPAIGGCRFRSYSTIGSALKDVLRLAYMMTLKAATSDLPHGGAKAVLIKPKVLKDREAYFRSFGDFVHQLNGDYITSLDVGSTTEDMDIIAERTPYVIGATKTHKVDTNPSPYTAMGVLRGIEAAVKFKLNRDDLEGLHVAIQGAGAVGYFLSKALHERGAKITLCDTKPEATQRCVDEFGASVVGIDKIHDVPCDVFAPCALGGTLNLDTIDRLKTTIIAGAANNQLAHLKYGQLLHEKDILYAPDFIINSGGLINAAMVYDYEDVDMSVAKINTLYGTMLELFERSQKENKPTTNIAELMAKEKLANNTPH